MIDAEQFDLLSEIVRGLGREERREDQGGRERERESYKKEGGLTVVIVQLHSKIWYL